jgi:hypothetical protein
MIGNRSTLEPFTHFFTTRGLQHYFIVELGPPLSGESFLKAIDKALGKGIKGHRVKSASLVTAPQSDAIRKILCSVTLEGNCQDPLRRWAGSRL